MTSRSLQDIAARMSAVLRIDEIQDYPGAVNGVQVAHRGPVRGIAAAVDASARTIDGAIAANANLLLVHHGLFWAGTQPITGRHYDRLHRLFAHDIAVYAAHLPLDSHAVHGNSRLLALRLGLTPSHGFARTQAIDCGVRGESDTPTADLFAQLRAFSREHGGDAVATPFAAHRRTRRWAICSGAGANHETLREAHAGGIDTLIVGEGPHWSAVDAIDMGLTVLYGGHYATETLGVCSLAEQVAAEFALPWTFIAAPTGL